MKAKVHSWLQRLSRAACFSPPYNYDYYDSFQDYDEVSDDHDYEVDEVGDYYDYQDYDYDYYDYDYYD